MEERVNEACFYRSQLQVVAGNWKQIHRFQGGRHVALGRGQLQEELRCPIQGRRMLSSLQGSQNLLAPIKVKSVKRKVSAHKGGPFHVPLDD